MKVYVYVDGFNLMRRQGGATCKPRLQVRFEQEKMPLDKPCKMHDMENACAEGCGYFFERTDRIRCLPGTTEPTL